MHCQYPYQRKTISFERVRSNFRLSLKKLQKTFNYLNRFQNFIKMQNYAGNYCTHTHVA